MPRWGRGRRAICWTEHIEEKLGGERRRGALESVPHHSLCFPSFVFPPCFRGGMGTARMLSDAIALGKPFTPGMSQRVLEHTVVSCHPVLGFGARRIQL